MYDTSGPSVGAIIGGVILAIALVVGIVFLILVVLLLRRYVFHKPGMYREERLRNHLLKKGS